MSTYDGPRADPCRDVLGCGSLNFRRSSDPRPDRCPVCGGPLLHPATPQRRRLGYEGEGFEPPPFGAWGRR